MRQVMTNLENESFMFFIKALCHVIVFALHIGKVFQQFLKYSRERREIEQGRDVEEAGSGD